MGYSFAVLLALFELDLLLHLVLPGDVLLVEGLDGGLVDAPLPLYSELGTECALLPLHLLLQPAALHEQLLPPLPQSLVLTHS